MNNCQRLKRKGRKRARKRISRGEWLRSRSLKSAAERS
jgi:hypothetical protein